MLGYSAPDELSVRTVRPGGRRRVSRHRCPPRHALVDADRSVPGVDQSSTSTRGRRIVQPVREVHGPGAPSHPRRHRAASGLANRCPGAEPTTLEVARGATLERRRTTSTFSCDIAYSDSPTASRARASRECANFPERSITEPETTTRVLTDLRSRVFDAPLHVDKRDNAIVRVADAADLIAEVIEVLGEGRWSLRMPKCPR